MSGAFNGAFSTAFDIGSGAIYELIEQAIRMPASTSQLNPLHPGVHSSVMQLPEPTEANGSHTEASGIKGPGTQGD